MKQILIVLIRAYRYGLSPFLGSHCRYYPSCSSYTLTALEQHGLFAGLWLGIRRLARCHPWHEGGYDPVPESGQNRPVNTAQKESDTCCSQSEVNSKASASNPTTHQLKKLFKDNG